MIGLPIGYPNSWFIIRDVDKLRSLTTSNVVVLRKNINLFRLSPHYVISTPFFSPLSSPLLLSFHWKPWLYLGTTALLTDSSVFGCLWLQSFRWPKPSIEIHSSQ